MKKKYHVLVVFSLTLVTLLLGWFNFKVSGFMVDDSFIYFRYAENVSSGHGFVFNRGEVPGEGFTSWFWLLLLAFGHLLGIPPVLFSQIVGILFFASAGVLLFFLVQRAAVDQDKCISNIIATILTIAFIFNHRLMAHSVNGMETSLYIFFLLVLIYVTTRTLSSNPVTPGQLMAVGLCGFAAFLARPEGILAGMISLFFIWMDHRRSIGFSGFFTPVFWGFLVPVFLLLTVKVIIFGDVIPQAFYHKFVPGGKISGHGIRHLYVFFSDYIPLIAPAMILGIVLTIKRKKIYQYYQLLFVIMTGVMLFFYPVMNYMSRFYVPYLSILMLMLCPIFFILLGYLKKRNTFFYFFSVPLLLLLLMGSMNINNDTAGKYVRFWRQMVDRSMYRGKLAAFMRLLPEKVVVANTEMGVIPYFSRRTCIDMNGLTDPHLARNELSMGYLMKRKVDLIIFPRKIDTMPVSELVDSWRHYGNVFLSDTFKTKFEYLGFIVAWPNNRAGYHFYVYKESLFLEGIKGWYRKAVRYLEPKRGRE